MQSSLAPATALTLRALAFTALLAGHAPLAAGTCACTQQFYASASQPTQLWADDGGVLYIAHAPGPNEPYYQVAKYVDGTHVTSFAVSPPHWYPYGVAVHAASGNVYVDRGNGNWIVAYAPSLNPTPVAVTGTTFSGTSKTLGFSPSGDRLYVPVSNGDTGSFLSIYAIPGHAHLGNIALPAIPNGLAVDASGQVFIAYYSGIKVYDRDGVFLRNSSATGFHLAFGPDGRLYTSNSNGFRVYSPSEALECSFGSYGDGNFNLAWGISVSPQGLLYVGDLNNGFVKVFRGLAYTATPSVTPSFSVSPTATPSASPSASPSSSPTATPSATPSASPSHSPTATDSATASPSPTVSPTPSASSSVTMTPSPTATPSATGSATPTPTPSATPSTTVSFSVSPTPSPTRTPTLTRTASPSRTPTRTRTATRTLTHTVSPSPSPTPAYRASGLGKTVLAPVPSRRGEPLCLWYANAPAAALIQVYNSAGERVAKLGFGAEFEACADTAAWAPGVYYAVMLIVHPGGSTQQTTQKLVVLDP